MGYKVEEIRDLKNPYEELGNGDALAEHREELNKLTNIEMKDLASRMVLECPQHELKNFWRAIEAARVPQDDNQTFHAVLSKAYEIKKRIFALLDPRNPNPHRMILGREFDEELFNNHKKLAMDVLDKHETAIAERLAVTTPADKRNQVALNVKGIFPDSLLATKIGQAFAMRRDIDNLLLGENPHKFFDSREFSPDSCIEFPGLFNVIKDKESIIAGKLALNTASEEQRSDISHKIQCLIPTNDVFTSKVNTAFTLRRNIDRLLLGEKPEQFFTSRDFSADSCLEFSMLFPTLLKGQEQSIGEKLSLLDSKTRSDIGLKLEWINGSAHDQSSPFRLIAAAMAPKPETAPKPCSPAQTTTTEPTSSNATNPNTMFKRKLTEQRKILAETASSVEACADSDEESEEESCFSKICGFGGK